MSASKVKFIHALFWIDVALCLIVYNLIPRYIVRLGGGVVTRLENPALWMLFLAVIAASAGAFLMVDAFHNWPSKDSEKAPIPASSIET